MLKPVQQMLADANIIAQSISLTAGQFMVPRSAMTVPPRLEVQAQYHVALWRSFECSKRAFEHPFRPKTGSEAFEGVACLY